MEAPAKSSFMSRTISKEDAIIQFLRPQIGNKVTQAFEVLERMVTEAETLTKLGVKLQPGNNNGQSFFCTPTDLKANLDEFGELEMFASEGRALLIKLGYKSLRKSTPILGEGTAPVGKTVDVMPITSTLPGEAPLSGVLISPIDKNTPKGK